MQRHQRARTLHAVRFVDKKAPGIDLGIDEDYKASDCFSEVKRGYQMGVIEPTTMHGFKAIRPIWVSLEVIIPSQGGITPEQWKQTATLCPLDWPTNYSLLRLWHLPTSLHQFANLLYKQLDHRHMFTQWSGRGGQPQESTKQSQKRATRPPTEANQPTKRGQGQARPTTRRQKSQETQQPHKTTETNHRSSRETNTPRDQTTGESVRQDRDRGEGEGGEGQSTPYGALYHYGKKVLSS